MKILIIKLGALGDVINTLPLAISLKKHLKAEIHWLVAPLSFPLIRDHQYVDRVILFDKKNLMSSLYGTIKQIRQTQYDIVLDLQRLLKSGFFCMVAKSDRKIGFDKKRCKELSWLFPFERINPGDPESHMLLQYIEFADYLKIPSDKISWEIPWVKHPVKSGFNIDPGYIVLNIGATKPANRWKPEYFAELADMIENKTDLKSVITGGASDRQCADIIQSKANCTIENLCGKTSLQELSNIIANAKCVVSCDTGPMHLSVALGTNLIALFGPSNPGRTGPFQGSVIQLKLKCVPCNRKKCNDPICMDKITPDHVMNELLKKLK